MKRKRKLETYALFCDHVNITPKYLYRLTAIGMSKAAQVEANLRSADVYLVGEHNGYPTYAERFSHDRPPRLIFKR